MGDGAGRGPGSGVAQLATGSPPPGSTSHLRVCTRAGWCFRGWGHRRGVFLLSSTLERRRQFPEDLRQQVLALAVIPPAACGL